jgi:competence protein ComEA
MRLLSCAIGALMLGAALGGPSVTADQSKAAPSKATATAASPVNINTASPAQIETLPGIGARTAARIVEYRQKNGGFKKIEELMNVKGVGEKSFLKLKPLVTVSTDKAERSGGQ